MFGCCTDLVSSKCSREARLRKACVTDVSENWVMLAILDGRDEVDERQLELPRQFDVFSSLKSLIFYLNCILHKKNT